MNPTLRPIKTLNIISFALHAAAVFLAPLLLSLRYTVMPHFYNAHSHQETFPAPSFFIIAPIIVFFVMHVILFTSFRHAIQNDGCLKIISIVSLIAVIIVIPLLSYGLAFLSSFFYARHGDIYLIAQSTLQMTVNFALVLRGLGFSVLLGCAAISLYYTYYCKTQQKNC